MKSTNCEAKVLKPELDAAELVGLLTLYHMAKEIAFINSAGVQITLFTDEPFLYEMSQIAQRYTGIPLFESGQIELYQSNLKKLVRYFEPIIKVSDISAHDLNMQLYQAMALEEHNVPISSFMEEELDTQIHKEGLVEILLKEHDIAHKLELQNVSVENKESFNTLARYCSNIPRLKKVCENIKKSLPTRKRLKETAQLLARCYLKGAAMLRQALSDNFPEYDAHVRLSIRSSKDLNSKFGIQLVLGSTGTPWHNTLLVNGAGVRLVQKNEYENCCIRTIRIAQGTQNELNLDYLIQDTL
jgi:pyoverdine/dityrosine biosynthesis protein Dit1